MSSCNVQDRSPETYCGIRTKAGWLACEFRGEGGCSLRYFPGNCPLQDRAKEWRAEMSRVMPGPATNE